MTVVVWLLIIAALLFALARLAIAVRDRPWPAPDNENPRGRTQGEDSHLIDMMS